MEVRSTITLNNRNNNIKKRKNMQNESNVKMPLIMNEKDTVLINFDEKVVERTDQQTGEKHTVYGYESVRVKRKAFGYAGIVSAIVRSRYSADEVEAIVLNHGDGDAEHEAEYAGLQEWRKHAKEIAKGVV